MRADIRATFCEEVHHFENAANAASYTRGKSNLEVVTINRLAQIGQQLAAEVWGIQSDGAASLECPHCGHRTMASIPTMACQVFFPCPRCQAMLRPLAGDCCVFCSYADRYCPPKLQDGP